MDKGCDFVNKKVFRKGFAQSKCDTKHRSTRDLNTIKSPQSVNAVQTTSTFSIIQCYLDPVNGDSTHAHWISINGRSQLVENITSVTKRVELRQSTNLWQSVSYLWSHFSTN
ncbi:hypothetical protein J6590_095376 [Homalodisca vitripennis]|nr:hypothetical protein J6590_095376 [Homalodisca vitripennis]